jgi:hypothetical protein
LESIFSKPVLANRHVIWFDVKSKEAAYLEGKNEGLFKARQYFEDHPIIFKVVLESCHNFCGFQECNLSFD